MRLSLDKSVAVGSVQTIVNNYWPSMCEGV